MQHNIFGLNFLFHLDPSCSPETRADILEQLEIYPTASGPVDVKVEIGAQTPFQQPTRRNPSTHYDHPNGFVAQFRKYAVEIAKTENQLRFRIDYDRLKKGLIRYLKKLNNMEYASIEERIAQVLSEFVLMPAVYFHQHLCLIHSSGLVNATGRAVLLGGTGGVGKTSLELELCRHHNFAFLNDDIAVLDQNGMVHPNLAFPKIYAYNLVGNTPLKREVLDPRSWQDKMAWQLRSKLFGLSSVRRKTSPEKIFPGVAKKAVPLGAYIVLSRNLSGEPAIKPLTAQAAAHMSIQIMKTEYAAFHNHLYWHLYNAKCAGYPPIINPDIVFGNWTKMMGEAFTKVRCYQLDIPADMPHQSFIKDVAPRIKNCNTDPVNAG